MKNDLYILIMIILLLLLILKVTSQDNDLENDAIEDGELNCRERNRLITDDKDDLYNLVEVGLHEVTRFECHFCDEQDDGHAKNWFKMDNLDDSKFVEVQLDMDDDMDMNRVFVDAHHTLTIRNISIDDRGEYLCKGLDEDELQNDYLFYLDVVIPTDILPEKGNLTDWRRYHDESLSPVNQYLNESNEEAILHLKNTLHVSLQLETSWGRAGPCEICGRPKGDGRRFTEGHCRVKITHLEMANKQSHSSVRKLFDRATHLSCRSLVLHELVPGLINRTEYIPDFVLMEVCDGYCNPDAEGAYKGWRSTKKGFKYKKTFVLAENAHLTLVCPDSTLENHVQWKINNKVINAGESKVAASDRIEPRVFVDSFNTLYLYGVTKDEEGNYTCYVDMIRMQQVRIFVVSKSRLLTQAFLRHMIYLAFVLLMTLSCYCAGLILTYFRRHKFKTYREVRHDLKVKFKLMEEDLSDVTISQQYDTDKTTSGRQSLERLTVTDNNHSTSDTQAASTRSRTTNSTMFEDGDMTSAEGVNKLIAASVHNFDSLTLNSESDFKSTQRTLTTDKDDALTSDSYIDDDGLSETSSLHPLLFGEAGQSRKNQHAKKY